MKLIITGATGFLGARVLARALTHPSVTAVISLARRKIPENQLPPKRAELKQLTLPDEDAWLNYSDEVKAEIKDADGWVWTLGPTPRNNLDPEALRRVLVGYTRHALETIVQQQADATASKTVRFAYVSGGLAIRDQNAKLWFMDGYRQLRGLVESMIVEYGSKDESKLKTCVARPMRIVSENAFLSGLSQMTGLAIGVDQLAAWLVDAAIRRDGASGATVENQRLRDEGIKLLDASG